MALTREQIELLTGIPQLPNQVVDNVFFVAVQGQGNSARPYTVSFQQMLTLIGSSSANLKRGEFTAASDEETINIGYNFGNISSYYAAVFQKTTGGVLSGITYVSGSQFKAIVPAIGETYIWIAFSV